MKHFFSLLLALSILSCDGPIARKPVKVTSGSYIKESVARNKKLLAEENKQIQSIIDKDSTNIYRITANGAWYFYTTQNRDTLAVYPRTDDLVTLTYNIVSFTNDTIYSSKEIDTLTYKVDKTKLFPGLRNSIKLLKENETATFLFPSSLGFGYHGDENRIGPNTPIKLTITILKIEQQKDSI
ncbi:MAG: gliding motility-associated peptidyl-prolyl isomerase GldI [Cellulophaga sp.]